MKKLAIFLTLLLSAQAAIAGSSSSSLVKRYIVTRYGKLFFTAGPQVGAPQCSQGGEWAVDLVGPDAAAGKAILATIIAAHAAGKTVHVQGKGVCDVWSDRETVDLVYVE